MKIALVSPYDFAYPGGVNNHVSALERQFTKMGHEVRVIAPASRVVPDFGDRFIHIGKPLPIRTADTVIRITISLGLASKIKAVLAEENFDIINIHEPFMPMLSTGVLRFSHTANVGTFHGFNPHIRRTSIGYNFWRPLSTIWLKRRVYKLHGKIAVSKPAMEFANKHLSGHYNIIPNGIDLEQFSPDVAPIDEFCDGKLNILFVGRMEKRKGLKYLLEAYKQVKKEIPDSRLIIVGPGTKLRKKYEKQVKDDELKDVVFVGYVSHDELPRYYKTADIYCAPATGMESFGIVLLEAMAVGTSIVASNIDGYASVVTHGVEGLLVPPKDSDSLAQALISLLRDELLRQQMGDRGRIKAQDYSWEHIAQMVLNYYMKILSQPPWKKQFSEFEATSV